MSDSEDKKTEAKIGKLSDLDKNFQDVVVPAPMEGDKRRTWKRFKKGHVFSFNKYETTYTLQNDVMMEVTETYTKGEWGTATHHTDTTYPAPSLWRRIKAWLMYPEVPSDLPQAKVVKK